MQQSLRVGGPGEFINPISYIENLLDATRSLMDRMERGVQTYIYVDEPALTTGRLVERIYKLLGKTPPSWHIPLSVASPIATVSDFAADLTGIDFPITAARIEKFNRSMNFDAGKIREEGFEQSPEGTQNYVGYLQDRADLFENFFAEKFTAAIITIITWVTNPVGLLFTLLAAALAATWLYRNHGRVLDIISSDPGKSQRRRERIELERQEQIASAADEHLSDLPEVGTMGEVYWQDAYQVATVYELAELFRNGIPVSDGDDLYHVGGVEGLSASSVHESWLEPVVRDGRLASVEIALSHGAAALHRMMSKYGMAMEYRETYEQVRQLQEDLDDQAGYGRSHSFDIDGSPTGGDD